VPDRCRSCKQQVRWATTEHGKAIPLDPEPAANGSIRLRAGVAIVVPEAERQAFAGELYLSHFATCPDAARHRRRP
jgi:hypothetical protein